MMSASSERSFSNRVLVSGPRSASPHAHRVGPLAPRLRQERSIPPPPPPFEVSKHDGSHFPLEISPDPISLGTLDPGRSAIAKLTLRNSGSHPVIVARVETSCPCLNVAEQSTNIGPGRPPDLTVKFDPRTIPISEVACRST